MRIVIVRIMALAAAADSDLGSPMRSRLDSCAKVREPLIRRSAPDQPDVPDGVRELRPPRRLAIRKQVELASVIGSVAVTHTHTTHLSAVSRKSRLG